MKKFLIIVALMAFCLGAAAQEKRYSVKSGILTMEMDMMGQTITQTTYFDDYGAKQATLSDFRGRNSRNITVDGQTIMIDDEARTAVRMPGRERGPMGGGPQIDFSNLDEKTIKKNKIKEVGQEEVIGKLCTVYSYRVMMMGRVMNAKAWVYKGITLKTSMKTDFGEMGNNAVKLEEDVEIDPAMFTVPEGVEITEMEMRGGMGGPMGGGGMPPMGGGGMPPMGGGF